jgi:hypothetical protein
MHGNLIDEETGGFLQGGARNNVAASNKHLWMSRRKIHICRTGDFFLSSNIPLNKYYQVFPFSSC